MSVRIIETAAEDALYRRYDGQTSPQPCYIELDLNNGTLSADYDSEVGNAVPSTVRHGFERRYAIPAVTGSAADDLMRKIAPLADRVLADWDSEWDGNNTVAVLGEDAAEAENEIVEMLESDEDLADDEDLVTVWGVDGVITGSEADEYDITAETTDERLDEIEEEIRKGLIDISPNGIVVLDGIDRHLRELRDELLRNAIDEAVDAAEDAAEQAETADRAANAAAMERARAVVEVVRLTGSQAEAARRLHLDPSTVNKLIAKAQKTNATS
jgi:hypothetical protein